jgi:hypothetical protein
MIFHETSNNLNFIMLNHQILKNEIIIFKIIFTDYQELTINNTFYLRNNH